MVGIDSYTKFLSHFNGVDGSTDDYIAETGQIISLENTAQLDDLGVNNKFSTSLLLDILDYATIPSSAEFDLGTGDFTIESWFRLTADIHLTEIPHRIISRGDVTANNGDWALAVWYHSYFGCTFINFAFHSNEVTTDVISNAVTINENIWYHLVTVRVSGVIYLYLNGIQISLWNSGNCSASLDSTSPIYIGCRGVGTGYTEYLNGRIDEPRISNIARWTGDFIPPTSEYTKLSEFSQSIIIV